MLYIIKRPNKKKNVTIDKLLLKVFVIIYYDSKLLIENIFMANIASLRSNRKYKIQRTHILLAGPLDIYASVCSGCSAISV